MGKPLKIRIGKGEIFKDQQSCDVDGLNTKEHCIILPRKLTGGWVKHLVVSRAGREKSPNEIGAQ